jgi:hypothetical protein
MDPQPAASPAPSAPPSGEDVAAWKAAMLKRVAEICIEVAESIGRQARADLAPANDLILSSSKDAPGGPEPVLSEEDAPAADKAPQALILSPSTAKGRREAANDDRPKIFEGDLALGISRVARAIRLTCAMHSLLTDGDAQGAGKGAGEAADGARTNLTVRFVGGDSDRRADRKAEVGAIVRRLAEADLDGIDDDAGDGGEGAERPEQAERPEGAERVERLVREAAERMDEVETFGDILARPLSEFVEVICREVGLAPDWARLAGEPWARAELAGGAVGAPLAACAGDGAVPARPTPPESPSRHPPPPDPPPSASRPSASRPPASRPPDPPVLSEAEREKARIAAATAARWEFAEFGPQGRPRPPPGSG